MHRVRSKYSVSTYVSIIYREKIIKKQKTKKKEKKVRQNLLDSDYEIYIVRLLVTTVNWHKSLQHNTLALFIYDFISRFDYYITPRYYFLIGARVLRCVFPSLIYIIS